MEITAILIGLVVVIGFLIGKVLWPIVQQRLLGKLPSWGIEALYTGAAMAVSAMEALYGSGKGDEKLKGAIEWLGKQLAKVGLHFNDEDILNAIKAQWLNMNTQQIQAGIKKPPDAE